MKVKTDLMLKVNDRLAYGQHSEDSERRWPCFPLRTCVGAGLPPEFSLAITVVALIVKAKCAIAPGPECCTAQ